MKNPNLLLLSLSLPAPPPETVFFGGLPQGAIEAIKAAYGVVLQILDPPRDGFNLTVKLNLSKLPPDEGSVSFLFKAIHYELSVFDDKYLIPVVEKLGVVFLLLHPFSWFFVCNFHP